MTRPEHLHCQIRIKGHFPGEWSDWFSGLMIENQADGDSLLSGSLPDQSALYGVLDRMRDLGLEIVSVSCIEADAASTHESTEPDPHAITSALPPSG